MKTKSLLLKQDSNNFFFKYNTPEDFIMVTLLIGKKGTGKTKKLISLANEAVAASSGNVVVFWLFDRI